MDFKEYRVLLESYLTGILPLGDDDVAAAMRYSCLEAGKRLRPALVYATGTMLGATIEQLHAAAASVELVHCYTLIHDDLPAMDDDNMRRGKPSCHKAFSESTAILAGDALQSLAFEILSDPSSNPIAAEQRIKQVNILARAIGANGLVLGQAADMAAENKTVSLHELEFIHSHKTGALFLACVQMAQAASDKYANSTITEHLQNYAKNLGLLFQIQDDILDVTGDTQTLGKTVGIDTQNTKSTYPSILGLDLAKQQAYATLQAAKDALDSFGAKARDLLSIVEFSYSRNS